MFDGNVLNKERLGQVRSCQSIKADTRLNASNHGSQLAFITFQWQTILFSGLLRSSFDK